MTPEHLQQSLRSSKVTCRDELFALQLGVYRKIHKYTTAAKRPIPPDPISLLLTSTPHRTSPNTKPSNTWTPMHFRIFTNFCYRRLPTYMQPLLDKSIIFFTTVYLHKQISPYLFPPVLGMYRDFILCSSRKVIL